MICQRCKGLLVPENLGDLRDEAICMYSGIRCINCGYVEDAVVRANRLHSPATKRSTPRRVVKNGGVVLLRPHSEEYHSV